MRAPPEKHFRFLRFALVGALCFAIQYLAMVVLVSLGVDWPVANAAGFVVSAQVNFALSAAFTWGDRRTIGTGTTARRWLSYNAAALLGALVSTAVFASAHGLVGAVAAAVLGVGAAAVLTYVVCHHVVFRPGVRDMPDQPTAAARREVVT